MIGVSDMLIEGPWLVVIISAIVILTTPLTALELVNIRGVA